MMPALFFAALEVRLEQASNAVYPIPTWPISDPSSAVDRSTTPPSDTVQHGALDFPLWQHIGEEIMVKSNINNWIACVPLLGSLATWIVGSLDCRMIKSITNTCSDLPYDALSALTFILV